ncbi:MAG: von Willebrand factor type A domain-containing protein [Myxococcales bacterium]|nr:von Willebrand factor type A domain-containing protein [Myxococcales bacterium]
MGRASRLVRFLAALSLAGCGAGRAPSLQAPEAQPEPAPFAALTVVEAGPLAGMHFHHYGVNPTVDTAEDPRSTFGLSADTATWQVARGHLGRGQLPPAASVRVEDFVNAFRAPEAPAVADVFSLQVETFPSPNRPGYHVVRLDLRAGDAPRRPVRVVAVVDVSGRDAARLDLAREALRQVFARLGPDDEVAVVAADGRALLGPLAPGDAAVRPGLAASTPPSPARRRAWPPPTRSPPRRRLAAAARSSTAAMAASTERPGPSRGSSRPPGPGRPWASASRRWGWGSASMMTPASPAWPRPAAAATCTSTRPAPPSAPSRSASPPPARWWPATPSPRSSSTPPRWCATACSATSATPSGRPTAWRSPAATCPRARA